MAVRIKLFQPTKVHKLSTLNKFFIFAFAIASAASQGTDLRVQSERWALVWNVYPSKDDLRMPFFNQVKKQMDDHLDVLLFGSKSNGRQFGLAQDQVIELEATAALRQPPKSLIVEVDPETGQTGETSHIEIINKDGIETASFKRRISRFDLNFRRILVQSARAVSPEVLIYISAHGETNGFYDFFGQHINFRDLFQVIFGEIRRLPNLKQKLTLTIIYDACHAEGIRLAFDSFARKNPANSGYKVNIIASVQLEHYSVLNSFLESLIKLNKKAWTRRLDTWPSNPAYLVQVEKLRYSNDGGDIEGSTVVRSTYLDHNKRTSWTCNRLLAPIASISNGQ